MTKSDYKNMANILGVHLEYNSEIKPGDLYLAGRNTSVKLFECLSVEKGWIVPTDPVGYPFDIHECVKVIEASMSLS